MSFSPTATTPAEIVVLQGRCEPGHFGDHTVPRTTFKISRRDVRSAFNSTPERVRYYDGPSWKAKF